MNADPTFWRNAPIVPTAVGAPLMLRAQVYMFLNQQFGAPRRVETATYTAHEDNFQGHTNTLLTRFEQFVSADVRVLLIGCNDGVEIPWIAERAQSVHAVDVTSAKIERAAARAAGFANVTCDVVDGLTLPYADDSFDFLFMHNVCEHILNLEACFREYHRVLAPGGRFLNSFAPLFYSPFGAHMADALTLPWGHLWLGPKAAAEVRNRYYPGVASAQDWADLGLNRVTERRYRQVVDALGFTHESYEIETSRGTPLVRHVPLLRNLFILRVTDLMRKP